LLPPGSELRTVHLVASRCTACSTSAATATAAAATAAAAITTTTTTTTTATATTTTTTTIIINFYYCRSSLKAHGQFWNWHKIHNSVRTIITNTLTSIGPSLEVVRNEQN